MEFLWHLNDSPVRLIDHYKSTETSFSVHFTPSPSTRSIICRKSLKLPFILSQGQKPRKVPSQSEEMVRSAHISPAASKWLPSFTQTTRDEVRLKIHGICQLQHHHLPSCRKKGKRQDDAAVNVGSGNTDMDRGRRSGDTRKALSWNCNLNWDTFFTAEDALHTPQPYFQRSTNARKMFYVESPSRLS